MVSDELKQANAIIRDLAEALAARENECGELQTALAKAVMAINGAEIEHDRMDSENSLLRKRLDDQSKVLRDTLWKRCVNCNPDLSGICKAVIADKFVEDDDHVGPYALSDVLGEGQFAAVRVGWKEGEENGDPFAVKTIAKNKIKSHAALKRLSNEVNNLKSMNSPHVISIYDTFNTEENFYIVTEKGGDDLFSFSGKYANGVNPAWVKEIMIGLMKGVAYIHRQGICHRDLKPENILMNFDTDTGKCTELKICDFGLSTSSGSRDEKLSEFCGSPGFFAPEMLVEGSYYGEKADLWSVACIMLELILGHVSFGNLWMKTYSMDTICNKDIFSMKMRDCLDEMPSHLRNNFHRDICDMLIPILTMDATARPTTDHLIRNNYFCGEVIKGTDICGGVQLPPRSMTLDSAQSADSAEDGCTDDEEGTPRKCQSWRIPAATTPPLSGQKADIVAETAQTASTSSDPLHLPSLEEKRAEATKFFQLRMPSFRKSSSNRSPIFFSRQISRSSSHNV